MTVGGAADQLKGWNFLGIADFSFEEISHLLDLAAVLKSERSRGDMTQLLPGRTLGMVRPELVATCSRIRPRSVRMPRRRLPIRSTTSWTSSRATRRPHSVPGPDESVRVARGRRQQAGGGRIRPPAEPVMSPQL